MTDRVQVLALTGSVLLLLLVLELVRRRRLAEEYSGLWIASALMLIVVSLRREVLDFAAGWLGIYYPPALLVLILVAIIAAASLSFSVILSGQQRQIDRLIEENAIMAAQLRELRESKQRTQLPSVGAVLPSQMVSDSPERSAKPHRQ